MTTGSLGADEPVVKVAHDLVAVTRARIAVAGATTGEDGQDITCLERHDTLGRDFDHFAGAFDELAAAEVFGRYLLGVGTDHVLETDRRDRERIFNLGYYTWVEQQGVSLADFDARRDPAFWDGLMDLVPVWDNMIETFNAA